MNNIETNKTPQPMIQKHARWKTFAITLTTIVGLIFIANGLSANVGFPGKHGAAVFSERFVDRMLDKVDASNEQITQVKAVIDNYKPSLQNMRGNKSNFRKEIATLLQAPNIDRAALESLREQHLINMEKRFGRWHKDRSLS